MTAPALQHAAQPGFLSRLYRELKRLVVIVALAAALFVAGKYYSFDQLNEAIRVRIENELREHYRGLAVTVTSARRVPGQGVEVRGIRIADVGGREPQTLAEIDEVFAQCDTRLPDFLTRPPQVQSLQLRRVKLRAERNANGSWNLAHLLPLPPCHGEIAPVATISDGTVEVVDPTQQPAGSWTLRNIELTVTPTPQSLARGDGNARVLQIAGTLTGDHLDRIEIAGFIDPATSRYDLRGAVEGLEFSPRLRAALPHELSQALAPLSSIRGRTHFGFHVERPADARPEGEVGGPELADISAATFHAPAPARPAPARPAPRFVVHGKIAEGRIDDQRLPEPLTDVEGTIRCDNYGVLIEDLSARCGPTHLELNASLSGYSGTGPMDLELTARQVQLERLPADSFPEAVAEALEQFAPRGLVDVAGRVHFDGCRWHPDLALECHDVSLAYEEFPYRLTDGSGSIVLKPGLLSVRLKTMGGGQVVRCRAEIRDPGPLFTGWIDLQSEGPIPIDDKLLGAMDFPTRRLVRSFRPRGAATFQARFHRDPGEQELHRHLSIQLRECSIQHEQFRYPIDKVSGSLELTDDAWLFRFLRGRNDSAQIVGEGSWLPSAWSARPAGESGPRAGSAESSAPAAHETDDSELKLQFTATNLPLAEELRQALPPAAQRLWSSLRPQGNIDHLVVILGYENARDAWSLEVKAEKWPPEHSAEGRRLSLEPAWFPYRLDNLTGSLRYQDGVLHLRRLQAEHGRAAVSAEGTCRMLPEGGCRLDLTQLAADRVAIDHELLAALPAGLGKSIGRYPLEGPLNLLGTLSMTVPPQADAQPQLQWDLSLAVENGRIGTAIPIEHVFGGLRLAGRHGPEGLFSRGELGLDSATIQGVQLTQVQGPFWLDGERLVFGALAEREAPGRPPRQLSANVFGGRLALDGELSLSGDGAFHVQPALENADLALIARELAPHHRSLSGKVFAVANIAGSTLGKHTWRGDGQVRLRDADIYELPVMIALLKLLTVTRPNRTAFSTSSIDFRIEGDDLTLDRIDFSGDAISLKGTGRMNAQRQVDLKFYPIMGREERILPVMRPLFGETGREFMLIEVTGTLDQPKVTQRVFPRIDAQLQQIFPELARDELLEPDGSILSRPRDALDRLRLLPRR